MKVIITKQQARKKLAEGAELMFECVGTTLSPKGRQVAFSRKWNAPTILRDGVSVARQVEHPDEFVDMGVKLIREAADKTVQDVGDSTTSTVILAHHLIKGGMKLIDEGGNPMVIRSEVYKALSKILPEIDKLSEKVDSSEKIAHIATVSSNSSEIGQLVAQAIDKVGKDGQITVEETTKEETYLDHVEGMTLEKGYTNPYFITNPNRMEAVIENPIIAIIRRKVTLPEEIIPLLQVMIGLNKDKNMVIVGNIDGNALKVLVENKMAGNVNILAIDVPGFGDRRDSFLTDVATLTGGKVLDSEIGKDASTLSQILSPQHFGIAKTIVASKNSTTILPLTESSDKKIQERIKATKAEVTTHLDSLRSQVKRAEQQYDREVLQERIAKLTTGVAVIKVGTRTQVEMREKVELVKDAIGAATSSIAEGMVAGGGVTYLRLAKILESETTQGGKLLHDTLFSITKKILANAGETDERLLDKIYQSKGNIGYEVNSGMLTDLVKAGVIDPARAIRLALENAVAVSTSILTTDVLIADEYIKPVAFKDQNTQ